MNLIYTEPFRRDYRELPPEVRRAADKALGFFLENPRRSSLRSKKLPGTEIWYARVTRSYRFTFQRARSAIILRRIGTHEILSRERSVK